MMSPPYRILVGSLNPLLRDCLCEQLCAEDDLEADSVATAQDLDEKAGQFDLLILDEGFAAGSALCGHRILWLIPPDTRPPPDTGITAEDTLTKPFRVGDLLARLRRLCQDHCAMIGPYNFQPDQKRLHHRQSGQDILLTEKETAILQILYGAEAIDRETLLKKIWVYNADVTTHTLETHIYRLRQKIEPDPDHLRFLVTEPVGYRLICEQ